MNVLHKAALWEPELLTAVANAVYCAQTGTLGCTETQPAPQVPSGNSSALCSTFQAKVENLNKVIFFSAELDFDDRSIMQSPEPELLYYGGSEDPEGSVLQGGGDTAGTAATPWGSGAAQDRCASSTRVKLSPDRLYYVTDLPLLFCPHASTPLTPATVAYTPPVPTVAPSHNFSYHNTDSAEVTSVSHCPPNNLAGTAEGETNDRQQSFLPPDIYGSCLTFCVSYRGRRFPRSRDGETLFDALLSALILSCKHDYNNSKHREPLLLLLMSESSRDVYWLFKAAWKPEGSSSQQLVPEGPAEETAEPPIQVGLSQSYLSGTFRWLIYLCSVF